MQHGWGEGSALLFKLALGLLLSRAGEDASVPGKSQNMFTRPLFPAALDVASVAQDIMLLF